MSTGGQRLWASLLSCLFVWFVQVVGSASGSAPLRLGEERSPGGSVSFRLFPLLHLGDSSQVNGGWEFGDIVDLTTDAHCNLYVLDRSFPRISKWDESGNLLSSIDLRVGDGPGEVRSPKFIAVDSSGTLFVADRVHRRVNVVDQSGHFVGSFPLELYPADGCVGPDGCLYVIGFPFSYRGPLVKVYAPDGSLVRSFCERPAETEAARMSGNSGRIATDQKGYIYHSFHYPYEIRRYATSGELVASFGRKVGWFRPPKVDPVTRAVEDLARVAGLGFLPDGKILHVVGGKEDGATFAYFMDIFNPDGSFIYSLTLVGCGLVTVRCFEVDRKGNIYFDHVEPYPHIVKYRLERVER